MVAVFSSGNIQIGWRAISVIETEPHKFLMKGKINEILILGILTCIGWLRCAKQVKGPNGEDSYLVKCGNLVKDKCMEKAASICPHGYNALDRNADHYDDLTKVGNAGGLEIKADTTTIMMIQCK
jgi:hypothetical protein